ncbi:MAG: hypothetical protein WBA46_19490 [Thermomicrobiales bacterium]
MMADGNVPKAAFDPARYLTKVKGADYLEVKWRLVWLRDQYPDSRIETDLIAHSGNQAIFKATVTVMRNVGEIGGSATGWGSEDAGNFANYIEKAETKAIGRALAALGFGTQFCDDMVYGAAEGHVVDAPVHRGPQPTAMFSNGRPQQNREQQSAAPSPKQLSFIRSVARELRMDEGALNQLTQELVGADVDQISRRDASVVIEALKARQGEQGGYQR